MWRGMRPRYGGRYPRKPGDFGDSGNEGVAGRRLAFETGETDEVVRERKALDRSAVAAVQRRIVDGRGRGVGRQEKAAGEQVALV